MKTTKLERAILLTLKTHGNEAVGRGDLITMAQRLFPGKNVIDCTLVEDAIRELKRRGLVSSSCGNTFFELTSEGYRAATVELMGMCWHRCDLLAERGAAKLRPDAAKDDHATDVAAALCLGIVIGFGLVVVGVMAVEFICRVW